VRPGRILLGVALIALGVVFLLDRADVLDAGETIGDWWPAAIIAVGAVQLFDRPRSLLGPGIVIGIGVILLLFTTDVVTGSVFALLWPALLIAVGVGILFRHGRGSAVTTEEGTTDDVVRATAVFGGHEVASRSTAFKGGSATAVFGGVTIDLRNAQLDPEGARLDVTALLGGVEILVPKGWRVTTSGTPILGGIDNKTAGEAAEGPELRIDALTILGGTDIKHER
jgi:predicted membrane protein